MKTFLYHPLLLLGIFLFACKKEEAEEPQTPQQDNIVDIGSYSLLESSRNAVPYKGKSSATFIDSIGNELTFPIESSIGSNFEGCLWKYDVYQPGDAVQYCYKSQNDNYWLRNDARNLDINITLEPRPFYSDPESGKLKDVLTVTIRSDVQPNVSHQIFHQTIDFRTNSGVADNNIIYPQITFWGKEFFNAYRTNLTTPYRLLYYNQEFGIIAFTDHSGKLWRFKEMF